MTREEKQDHCNTCGYEEGSIYCKEHCPHEAKIKQELTEFEEIDFMQEHKKIPVTLDLTSCEDAISRKIISAFLSGLISNETERKKALQYINELPSVNLMLCENAISRAEAVRVASGYCHPTNVAKELAKLPSVNPTKTGHWIRQGNTKEPLYGWYFCSECNSVIGDKPKFCSNCGAKMVEPQESEDKQ